MDHFKLTRMESQKRAAPRSGQVLPSVVPVKNANGLPILTQDEFIKPDTTMEGLAKLMTMRNTRFNLAECQTVSRVTRAFVDECVAKHIEGKLTAAEASMAKYWATDQLSRIVDECLQLHGGYGYVTECPIAQLYADTRVQCISAAPTK